MGNKSDRIDEMELGVRVVLERILNNVNCNNCSEASIEKNKVCVGCGLYLKNIEYKPSDRYVNILAREIIAKVLTISDLIYEYNKKYTKKT